MNRYAVILKTLVHHDQFYSFQFKLLFVEVFYFHICSKVNSKVCKTYIWWHNVSQDAKGEEQRHCLFFIWYQLADATQSVQFNLLHNKRFAFLTANTVFHVWYIRSSEVTSFRL